MSEENIERTNPTDADEREAPPTLVYTRCVFFRHEDTTILERMVNYFLAYAGLAALHRAETSVTGEEVLITLWIEPMPGAAVDDVYRDAIRLGSPSE